MRKHSKLLLFITMLAIGTIGWWRLAETREVSKSGFIMGTYVETKAYGRQAKHGLELVFDRLHEIEQKMTINQADSEISRVNQQAGVAPVRVSPDTFAVVRQALKYAELTNGKFDPTIQPIVALWRIGSPEARVPKASEIKAKLALVDYQLVQLDNAQSTIFLPKVGMGLDLGAIAKGYAADQAVAILRQVGVHRSLINIGGNVFAQGQNPDGTPWNIGLQDPLDERNAAIAVVAASDETLVTSGAYERFLDQNGKRYHHILDPDTGYPAESELLSATIVTKTSIDADALSTSLFILGRERGLALLTSLPGVDAVLIDQAHRIFVTPGLRNRLKVISDAYQLMP